MTHPAIYAATTPGRPRTVVCAWCLEDAPWCEQTGGPHPCEGDEERTAALHDTYNAPEARL